MSKFNWPNAFVKDPETQANNDALKLYLDSLATTSGGGITPSWAAYSPSVDWVQDPDDDFTFWMPIDYEGPSDAGDSGDAWTTVDHRGTGQPTLLVPPTAGAHSFGAHFSYKVVHAAGPYNLLLQHGPAIIYKSGATYGVEIQFSSSLDSLPGYPADNGADQIIARSVPGFAPLLDPTQDGDEYGFACYVRIDASSGFTPGSTDVRRAGFASMLWAYKVA